MAFIQNFLHRFRSSLNLKFMSFYVLAAFIPLVAIIVFFYSWSSSTLLDASKDELKGKTSQVSASFSRYFDRQTSMLLQLAGNPAFVRYYTEPDNQDEWKEEVEQAFSYIQNIFPAELDEACFISAGGPELARIVHDEIAVDDDLSPDESEAPFFAPTFTIGEGDIYQTLPYESVDSGRYVIATTTPIVLADGSAAALAHFEVNLISFQTLLKENLGAKEGVFGFIVNREDGTIMAHTDGEELIAQDFELLPAAFGKSSVPSMVESMLTGDKTGVMELQVGGDPYLVSHSPIAVPDNNENQWMLVMAQPKSSAFQGSQLFGILALFLGLGIGVMVLSGSTISRKITRPLAHTIDKIEEVASGDGDLTVALPVPSQDEIGQVSSSFNHMIARIRELMEQIQGATMQTDVGHATVAQLAKSSHEISANTESLVQMAGDSVRHVQDGMVSISKVATTSEAMREQMKAMSDRVLALGDKFEQVESILQLIDGIARQTNLLAINAAIEAARAGEHGKGFAVVADEVRSLAERSLGSTRDIENLVSQIRDETKATIDAAHETRTQVEADTQVVDEANKAFESLAEIVKGTMSAARAISDNVANQQQVSDEVAVTMDKVQDAVKGYKTT